EQPTKPTALLSKPSSSSSSLFSFLPKSKPQFLSLFESLLQPKQTQSKPSFLNMTACVGIRWLLFEHFGPILGGFEVWVYMPSSRTAIVL
ncbi:unnamed protein product, partial [Prunus brigantina]